MKVKFQGAGSSNRKEMKESDRHLQKLSSKKSKNIKKHHPRQQKKPWQLQSPAVPPKKPKAAQDQAKLRKMKRHQM